MIDREQLAAALGRLDARDREVLDYSLRRRVPDEDLAAIFGGAPSDVARLRAGAVERLADDLGVQRGEVLGRLLKELLDGSTWDLVPVEREEDRKPLGAGAPAAAEPAPAEPLPAPAEQPVPGAEPGEVPPAPPAGSRPPVLGMLAGGEPGSAGDGRAATRRRWTLAVLGAAAVIAPAAIVGVVAFGGGADGKPRDNSGSGTRPFNPQPQAVGDPFPTDPASANRYPVAYVRRPTVLYRSPGGKPRLKISRKTEWGSPRYLGVVRRSGTWLAVTVSELRNDQVAWVRDDRVARLTTVGWAVRADLSERRVTVERDGKVIRRIPVGIGRVGNETPTGRFAVTDKLRVTDPSSPYGCCVVALTGHQVKLPPGWPGGDRLAIHATRRRSDLGKRVSLGCLRADPRDARWLLRNLPLGTPVFIRR